MDAAAQDASAPGLRFRLMGFEVSVHASFFVMGALLGMNGGGGAVAVASWLAITFVAVLWHELGHALVARAFGLSARIELSTIGGLTYHEAPAAGRWPVELVIAVAGPSMGLALGGAVWLATRHIGIDDPFVAMTVRRVLEVNIGWSLINLLPILPYDGGLALRALLSALTPRAAMLAEIVSVAVGVLGALFALHHRSFWAAYLAIAACVQSGSALLARRRAHRLTLAWEALYDGDTQAARDRLRQLPDSLQASNLLRATLDLADGKPASLAGIDSASLREMWPPLATSWIHAGHAALLDRLLGPTTISELAPDVLQLVDASLFHSGDFARAAHVATASFGAHHQPTDAYNAACSYARLGDAERAMEWLETAVSSGFDDLAQARGDADLGLLRDDPRFAACLARIVTS